MGDETSFIDLIDEDTSDSGKRMVSNDLFETILIVPPNDFRGEDTFDFTTRGTSFIDLLDEDPFDFGKRSVPKDLFETNYFYLIDEDPSDFGKRSIPIFL